MKSLISRLFILTKYLLMIMGHPILKKTVFIFFALVLSNSLFAIKYYVKPAGNNSNDGLSWATAKANIAGALTPAINGDTIFVAVGTYTSSAGIAMKNGVSVYGGFIGIESSLTERPAMSYGVNDYGQSSMLIGSASYVVDMQFNYNSLVTLDGFTIQALGSSGIIFSSNTKVFNCTIFEASVSGLRIYDPVSSIVNCTIENCIIKNNGTRTNSNSYNGGGIYMYNATATFIDCIINGNYGQAGAGVFVNNSSSAIFRTCSIINNEGYSSGGIEIYGTVNLINCFIMNNRAWHNLANYPSDVVGGIYNAGSTTITGCIIANNTATSTHSTGANAIGGIFCTSEATILDIINSNIVNNLAETNYSIYAGGISCSNKTYLTDCILWGNKKDTQFSQLYSSPSIVNYTAIQGTLYTGVGNINLMADNTGSETGSFYPYFITPSPIVGCGVNSADSLQVMQSNWSLSIGSACINMGIPNTSGLNLPETDIYYNPRIFNERIDIGAAEYSYLSQLIEWDQTLNFSVNDGSAELTATATSGLPVTYMSSNTDIATVSNNILTFHNVGEAIITAIQGGNELYEPAPDVNKPLTVTNLTSQTIIWNQDLQAFVGDTPITLTAMATSGLPVSYSSDNTDVGIINGDLLYIVGTGIATITAIQSGDANYSPAPEVNKPLTVSKQDQVIIWNQDLQAIVGDAPITLTAMATSGLSVSYSSDNNSVGIVNNDLLYIVGPGIATITAIQSGNGNYNPAADIEKELLVNNVGIEDFDANIEINLYPNPTEGELYIENQKLNIKNIDVFDITGRKLSFHNYINSSTYYKIDISDLTSGTYFIKISTDSGETIKKVVKK
ncbi:MAG: T9SS type A sorting domain-containing protein [Bacteroidales bacterium]|jgi:hypothetical protein|nr:T9SS type A sorting domain-containing protein [Bacteroidales bacterium]